MSNGSPGRALGSSTSAPVPGTGQDGDATSDPRSPVPPALPQEFGTPSGAGSVASPDAGGDPDGGPTVTGQDDAPEGVAADGIPPDGEASDGDAGDEAPSAADGGVDGGVDGGPDDDGSDDPPAPQPADQNLWQYPLHLGAAVTVERDGTGFTCRPQRTFAAATPAWGLSQNDLAAARTLVHSRAGASANPFVTTTRTGQAMPEMPEDESGIAEAFVDLLRHEVIPPVPGFRVVRLVPPPEARGERPVDDDAASSVVVGERVVVTWVRQVSDAEHEAPRTLAHLDAVEYFEVPETHGMLLWTTPNGREVPVAWATKYLPRARDGWDWCLDLTHQELGAAGPPPPGTPRDPWQSDFPARLGRCTAKLHLALATPSSVIPEPTDHAPADLVRAWHSAASRLVDAAAGVGQRDDVDGVAEVLLPRLPRLRAAVDALQAVADDVDGGAPTTVQRVHGDLHVGQILRWPGGLVVVDFHPNPVVEIDGLSVGQPLQPAARDLARLLRSLDHVARVVDKGTGFAMTDRVDAWSRQAREQLLDSYRSELASVGRSELLDERLLPAFEAEQLCREIVYAAEHLPSWVYAPLGGLWQSFDVDPEPDGRGVQDASDASGAEGDVPRRRGRRAKSPAL